MSDRERTYRTAFAVLGALILVMGLALVQQSIHFNHRIDSQQNCLTQSFANLTKTLKARGTLASQEAQSTQDVILGVAASKTASDFERVLARYQKAVAHTAAERKAHPYPPFPNGTCE